LEKDLNKIREDIDSLDNQLLELFNKRMRLVQKVGKIKHKEKSAIYRPERERDILERLYKINSETEGVLRKDGIDALYLEIFSVARNLERSEKIAYLGPEGSFTHLVAESRFGAISDYLSLNAIQDVVQAVENSQAKFGVIPIENSGNGVVGETFDMLEKTKLKIIAEVYISVHHSFVSSCSDIKNIKRIYSKDIAFKQCDKFLKAYNLNSVDLIPVESTAKAAYLSSNDPDSGAICSSIASKLYNIPILFQNIEDSDKNKTRFIILSDFEMGKAKNSKTSIIVKFDDEDEAGVLYNFLKGFRDNQISMSRIQSRPTRDRQFKYSFFIDFKGDIRDDKIQKIVQPYKNNITWLGTYLEDS